MRGRFGKSKYDTEEYKNPGTCKECFHWDHYNIIGFYTWRHSQMPKVMPWKRVEYIWEDVHEKFPLQKY